MRHTTRMHAEQRRQVWVRPSTVMVADSQPPTLWTKESVRKRTTSKTCFRSWTYTDHHNEDYQLYAKLVKYENAMVTLEVMDGDQFMLPLTWFSQPDVEFFDKFGGLNYCPVLFNTRVPSFEQRSSALARRPRAQMSAQEGGQGLRGVKRKAVPMERDGERKIARLDAEVDGAGNEESSGDADVDMMDVDAGSTSSS